MGKNLSRRSYDKIRIVFDSNKNKLISKGFICRTGRVDDVTVDKIIKEFLEKGEIYEQDTTVGMFYGKKKK